MIGGVYGYLGIALAAAAMAAVCYVAGRSDGRALERGAWTEQQNTDLREANRALDAAHSEARRIENEKAQALSKVSASYQKGLKDGEANKAAALADSESGRLRLRVGLAGCEAIVSASGKTPAPAAGRDGGAASGLLDQSSASFLIAEASRADAIVNQLAACQQIVLKDRE